MIKGPDCIGLPPLAVRFGPNPPHTPILRVASCCIVGISDRLDLLLYDWIILHTTGHFQLLKPTITAPQHDFRKATLLTYNYSVGNVVLAYKKLRTDFQKDSRQR